MPLPGFEDLYRLADSERPALGVAAAGGTDPTVLAALREASSRGWVTPYLAGREAEVRDVAARHGIDLAGFHFLEAGDPAGAAVAAVRTGRAQLLMKGQIATPALMKAVLDPTCGLRTGHVICQIVLMVIRPAQRRLLLADPA